MAAPAYPDTFPGAQVADLLSLIRSGTVWEQLATALYDGWVIQGYGQRILAGDPSVQSLSVADTCELKALASELTGLAEIGDVSASADSKRPLLRTLLESLLPLLLRMMLPTS